MPPLAATTLSPVRPPSAPCPNRAQHALARPPAARPRLMRNKVAVFAAECRHETIPSTPSGTAPAAETVEQHSGRRGILAASTAAATLSLSNAIAGAFLPPDEYEVIGTLPENYSLPPVRFSPNAIKVSQLRYQQYLEEKIVELVADDVPYQDALRVGLLDAGLAGTLRFEDQLATTPGCEGLAEVVAQYGKVKAYFDENNLPMSWSDIFAVGGYCLAKRAFQRQYCGLEPHRFEARYEYKGPLISLDSARGIQSKCTDITDEEFLGDWLLLYQVVASRAAGAGGSQINIGRLDSPDALDSFSPGPGGTADEWKAWARKRKLTLTDLVPLSSFLSAGGEVDATLRGDPQLAKAFTDLDANAAFPGILENKISAAYAKCVRSNITLLDAEAYIRPAFLPGSGWLALLPIPTAVRSCQLLEEGYTRGAALGKCDFFF
mmetsp:Transcript_8525/g.31496  ORF Transcript_8525/g.31496 Transcript_8525/m.31496 type:complete len:435 (-) Transcript_8525:281-1585(-)